MYAEEQHNVSTVTDLMMNEWAVKLNVSSTTGEFFPLTRPHLMRKTSPTQISSGPVFGWMSPI